jgi:hypothetical protein
MAMGKAILLLVLIKMMMVVQIPAARSFSMAA